MTGTTSGGTEEEKQQLHGCPPQDGRSWRLGLRAECRLQWRWESWRLGLRAECRLQWRWEEHDGVVGRRDRGEGEPVWAAPPCSVVGGAVWLQRWHVLLMASWWRPQCTKLL